MLLSGVVTVLAGAFLWRSFGLTWGIFPMDWDEEKSAFPLPMAAMAALALSYVISLML